MLYLQMFKFYPHSLWVNRWIPKGKNYIAEKKNTLNKCIYGTILKYESNRFRVLLRKYRLSEIWKYIKNNIFIIEEIFPKMDITMI